MPSCCTHTLATATVPPSARVRGLSAPPGLIPATAVTPFFFASHGASLKNSRFCCCAARLPAKIFSGATAIFVGGAAAGAGTVDGTVATLNALTEATSRRARREYSMFAWTGSGRVAVERADGGRFRGALGEKGEARVPALAAVVGGEEDGDAGEGDRRCGFKKGWGEVLTMYCVH